MAPQTRDRAPRGQGTDVTDSRPGNGGAAVAAQAAAGQPGIRPNPAAAKRPAAQQAGARQAVAKQAATQRSALGSAALPGAAENAGPSTLTLLIRQRRTRSHLRHLPKWTARRPEPFGIGGLHWLPSPTGSRDPALFLHGGRSTILAVAEISPGVLRGPDAGDLGARLGEVLVAGAAGPVPLTRLQVLCQVPGPAGRTRAYAVAGLAYTPELVNQAARFAQGERGLTTIAAQAMAETFGRLGSTGTAGARLGPLVPLDRAAVVSLLGALALPGRGMLGPRHGENPWQPTEIDATAPRSVAITGPVGPARQPATWWHATGWVKRWPRAVGGVDAASCAAFLPPGVSGAASIVVGMAGPAGDRGPAITGYVTVSGHDAAEVELARVATHAAAEEREGFVEFCDRRHHLAFAYTLPLALGLRG
ncbi:MAG TPA: hypothetical protein VFU74_15425 [Actinocrinis sp.]|nr:hypothetical protein [Actinocrinis sp.]